MSALRNGSPFAVEEYKGRETVGIGESKYPGCEAGALAHDNRIGDEDRCFDNR